MNIVVLGCGMVGSAMAIDLAKDKNLSVTVVDKNQKVLDRISQIKKIKPKQADLGDAEKIPKLVSNFDLIINAVPGFLGYQTLKKIIETGKNVVDISFLPEDPFALDDFAKSKNVAAIVDCGVAPGFSNILVGYAAEKLDQVTNVIIYVGGLPVYRQWPFEYKAGFSPIDVIEEYTRPARFVEYGNIVTRPALSDPELIDFPEIGTLEAFNTDGLRTLINTIKAPNLKEKTLRYPGHIEKMRMLRESGFFSQTPIEINGANITPLEFTTKLLFPMWHMEEEDEDITVLQVQVEGIKSGKKQTFKFELLDRYNRLTKTTSMARTTGYTATVVAHLLLEGKFSQKGIIPPEYLGKNEECFQYITKGLEQRNIFIEEIVEEDK